MKKLLFTFIFFLFNYSFSMQEECVFTEKRKIDGVTYYIKVCDNSEEAIKLFKNKFYYFNKRYNLEFEDYTFSFKDNNQLNIENMFFNNYFSDEKSDMKYIIFLNNNILAYSEGIEPKNIKKYSEKILKKKEKKEKSHKMIYSLYCYEEDKYKNIKCSHENIGKIFIYNNYAFENEFKENEQRAIDYLSSEKDKFLISGKIAELTSGTFNKSYVIKLENGVSIYIGEENIENFFFNSILDEQKQKYLNFNKGDYVHILASNFLMSFSDKYFMQGKILDIFEYAYIFNQINSNKVLEN